ncbi:hypothetical protein [Kosmotoga pacifica]|uniref:Uncharacterized protein n=1 Tax=Kosmotoga pacifica TaxID=1330330 RepID=A0A0G2ZD65_9BACT|nr:hypothetical protein [Kosmotoga pacifica]AKI98006.1 hypothetical protein IX53_09415 [Kosmotoga pacifica]
MSQNIGVIEILNLLGELEDGSVTSSRKRFIDNYLKKLDMLELVTSDIVKVVRAHSEEEGKMIYSRAYGDLVNRLAELSGMLVDYVKYNNRDRITGIWRAGEKFELKVAAIIPTDHEEAKWISRSALLVLPEAIDLGRPFVTVEKLSEFFNLVSHINLPISTMAQVLRVDDNYDLRLLPVMELIVLAFKKQLKAEVDFVSMSSEWSKSELAELLNKVKLPTLYFIKILLAEKKTAYEIFEELNYMLEKADHEKVKSPMAIGAIMGALSKHYMGLKEPLVIRNGKYYIINEKYRDLLASLLSGN